MDGTGMFIHDSGHVYIGDWYLDKLHGVGLILFADGGLIYASFDRNCLNGFAVLRVNGNLIAGNFKKNKLHGNVNSLIKIAFTVFFLANLLINLSRSSNLLRRCNSGK